VRAFGDAVNTGDRVRDLVHRQCQMPPVQRVHGQAATDGRLEEVVTNALIGRMQVAKMQQGAAAAEAPPRPKAQRLIAQAKYEKETRQVPPT
jgi:hypothetical protein